MRILAARLSTYLCRRNPLSAQSRNLSSFHGRDERSIEEEAERKIGWFLKLIFAGTATVVAYQFLPYMDERRMKIVEIGGAQELLNMLGTAKDDRTRKEALRALDAISKSDEARGSLQKAGAISVIRSIPDSAEDAEVKKFKLSLLDRFKNLSYED
ncbi:uncharacterized protein [Coffea arabica]|uniref:Uncharacterized protein isoform X2 n=1 Tax=Coffea arabica TaxID=13443 RepID=A0ABM4WRK3_COFAR